MFHKIRLQLAAINAVVFLVLLVISGFSLYGYMEHRLYGEIDDSLMKAARDLMQPGPGPEGLPKRPLSRLVDQQVVALFWNDDGKMVTQLPEQGLLETDFATFGKYVPLYNEPQTVRLMESEYRTISLRLQNPLLALTPQGRYRVESIQLVRNIDSERQILDRLLMVLVVGSVIGAVVTVAAGFFLAGRALVPIKTSWEKQQQFVADASHELRTPLAVVRSHGELMLRHPDQTVTEQSQNISVILRESKRMSKLVGDLLTLARSDSDQMEIEKKPLQLDEILEDLGEQFTALAEIEGIELRTDIAKGVQLEADEARIRQLFVILLDNALKYTEEGTVTLASRKLHHAVEVTIKDSGIGISEGELPLVFDRFFRADKARNRASGGTGLGLSIAKWIVDVHHGKIWMESRLGEGTTVHVQFPVK